MGDRLAGGEIGNAAPRPQERSLLRSLVGLLATEHVCAPPDGAQSWRAVAEGTCTRGAGRIYVCPECGQHLMKVGEPAAAP